MRSGFGPEIIPSLDVSKTPLETDLELVVFDDQSAEFWILFGSFVASEKVFDWTLKHGVLKQKSEGIS